MTTTSPAREARTPRFSRVEWARLWVSYQRYAFLMAGVPAAIVAGVAWRWPHAWWAWGGLLLIALRFFGYAYQIGGRWPRKARATWLADRRIAAGRFDVRMVSRYCGDPCFRVVAREILRRARVDAAEQRRLIRQFAAEEAERGHSLIFTDATGAVRVKVDGRTIRHLPNTGFASPGAALAPHITEES